MKKSIIANLDLALEGKRKIDWVRRNMPILRQIESDFEREKPFKGLNVLVCIHLEAKTAYLAKVFAAGGADVSVTGSNPLSTKDDIAAALASDGLHVYAKQGVSEEELFDNMNHALDIQPNIIIDDGGDIVEILHEKRYELLKNVFGACEETTTGVARAKERANNGTLKFPIMLINEAECKYIFDNYHGTGQSVWDGIMRTTNLVIAGKTVVIVGFGWCGKGIADRAKGLGANVIVCEIDPIKAIDASMHGCRVMPLADASALGDIFITVTGKKNVLGKNHFPLMKNGVILANAGHFNTEINLPALESMAIENKCLRENIVGYKLENGHWLNVLGGGNLVNIACGDGHPAEIMDTSFALQALSAEYLSKNFTKLKTDVYTIPKEIDQKVARLRLWGMGIQIDE
jgi:adenosylhomocysteinase